MKKSAFYHFIKVITKWNLHLSKKTCQVFHNKWNKKWSYSFFRKVLSTPNANQTHHADI